MSNEEAAKLVDSKRYESIEVKEDFTFETVLSSRFKLDILEKTKEEGYFIKCIREKNKQYLKYHREKIFRR